MVPQDSLLSGMLVWLIHRRVAVLIICAVCDVVSFVLYGVDKDKARKGVWRIPEKALLLSAVPGGIGARVGMSVFHHKTRKWYFVVWCTLCMVLQAAFLVYLFTS